MCSQGNKILTVSTQLYWAGKVPSGLVSKHYRDLFFWEFVTPPIFNEFLQMSCQNLKANFLSSQKPLAASCSKYTVKKSVVGSTPKRCWEFESMLTPFHS